MSNKATLLLAIVAVILGISAVYFYYQYNSILNDPNRIARQEIQDLVKKVSRLILLPSGEDPVIATVNDPAALKNQPFFANAAKGDKVLIYTQARKAYLYDPVADKIVEVAPISLGNQGQAQVQQSTTATSTSGNKK